MRLFVLLVSMAGGIALAQAPAPPAQPAAGQAKPPAANLLTLPPDTLVATVDGQKIYARELQAVLMSVSEQQRQMALTDPRSLLEQVGLLRKLATMAEKAGLDQRSPVKEQLAYGRMMTLANAQLNDMVNNYSVSDDEIRKFYEQNRDLYTQARVKVIYIPFNPNAGSSEASEGQKVLSESEAKARAEKVYAEIQAGADFVKMVKQYSGDPTSAAKDGDFMPIRKSDQVPEEIKSVIFSLKPGQVSRPVRQPNGFYIFRLEGIDVEPYESVRTQLTSQLRDTQVNQFIETTRKNMEIKIEAQSAFPSPNPAAPGPK